MLSLLLALLVAQAPCAPSETTAVCLCKQGRASACEALRVTQPRLAEAIENALRAARLEEQLRQQEAAKAVRAEGEASSSAPEPPDCKGQRHHVISRPIADALGEHPTLRGVYKPRDSRFVAHAKDEKAHCGYQQWHRDVDSEVIDWLRRMDRATPEQFERFLREIYGRSAMRERFPHGF
ncbi:Wall-associated protein precursor [Myxococcaceae bacterium GXIMD 01537]